MCSSETTVPLGDVLSSMGEMGWVGDVQLDGCWGCGCCCGYDWGWCVYIIKTQYIRVISLNSPNIEP